MWTALVLVAIIAVGAFGLVLVLARRLRAVTERVNLFLPASEGGLPQPGTPIPEFAATSVDGTRIGHGDLAGADRIIAFLTTDCASCQDQVAVIRDYDPAGGPPPLVVVIGGPQERAEMVGTLSARTVVLEENGHGPIAESFDIHEFPAVLVAGQGYIHAAGHGLASVLKDRAPAPA